MNEMKEFKDLLVRSKEENLCFNPKYNTPEREDRPSYYIREYMEAGRAWINVFEQDLAMVDTFEVTIDSTDEEVKDFLEKREDLLIGAEFA